MNYDGQSRGIALFWINSGGMAVRRQNELRSVPHLVPSLSATQIKRRLIKIMNYYSRKCFSPSLCDKRVAFKEVAMSKQRKKTCTPLGLGAHGDCIERNRPNSRPSGSTGILLVTSDSSKLETISATLSLRFNQSIS